MYYEIDDEKLLTAKIAFTTKKKAVDKSNYH